MANLNQLADEFGAWLAANQDKRGSEQWNTVENAFRETLAQLGTGNLLDAPAPVEEPEEEGLTGFGDLLEDLPGGVMDAAGSAVSGVGSMINTADAEISQLIGGDSPGENFIGDALRGAGDAVQEKRQEWLGTPDSLPEQFMSGVGQFGGMVGTAMIPGVGPAAAIGAGVAMGADEAHERAEAAGIAPEDRGLETLGGMTLGAADYFAPGRVSQLFKGAPSPGRARAAADVGAMEGGTELAQATGQNAIERTYNPEQEILNTEAFTEGGIGAGVGALFGAATGGRRGSDGTGTPDEATDALATPGASPQTPAVDSLQLARDSIDLYKEERPHLAQYMADVVAKAEAQEDPAMAQKIAHDNLQALSELEQILPVHGFDPKIIASGRMQGKIGDETFDVKGAYDESGVEFNALDPEAPGYNPTAALAHEVTHHLQSTLAGTDVGKSLFVPFDHAARRLAETKDPAKAITPSMRRALGDEGSQRLTQALAALDRSEVTGREVMAYATEIAADLRANNRLPQQDEGVFSRAFHAAIDFFEKFGNYLRSGEFTGQADQLQRIMSGVAAREGTQQAQQQGRQPVTPPPYEPPPSPEMQGPPPVPPQDMPLPTMQPPEMQVQEPFDPKKFLADLPETQTAVKAPETTEQPTALANPRGKGKNALDLSKLQPAEAGVLEAFRGNWGRVAMPVKRQLIADDMVKVNNGNVSLTPKGMELANKVRDQLDRKDVAYSRAQPEYSRAAAKVQMPKEEFQKWWKGGWRGDSAPQQPSVTVDPETNEPQVFYHGTGKAFKSFGKPQSAKTEGQQGPFFFTDDPTFADDYAEADHTASGTGKARKAGGRQLPVFISAQNPYDFENPEHTRQLAQKLVDDGVVFRLKDGGTLTPPQIEAQLSRGGWRTHEAPKVQKAIRELGHDGFYVLEGGRKNLGVYDPKQIKSVFNEFQPGASQQTEFSRALPLAKGTKINLPEPRISAVPTLYDDEVKPVKGAGLRGTAFALQDRAREVWGGKPLKGPSDNDETLAQTLASEAEQAILHTEEKQERGKRNARNWYTQNIENALNIASEVHPELKADPKARIPFTLAMAITSQDMDVMSNAKAADEQYELFKQKGRFVPKGYGSKGTPIKKNLQLANTMLDKFGGDTEKLGKFLNTEFTAEQLNEVGKRFGFKIDGENKGTKVYGSAIFGPKIGNGFYQNLNQNYDPVTIDKWLMRTFGRLTGDVIGNPDVLPKQRDRLIRALELEGMEVPDIIRTDDEALIEHAIDVRRDWDRQYTRMRKDGKGKDDINKPEWAKAAAAIETQQAKPKDNPPSGGYRNWVRKVVGRTQQILRDNGYDMTPADIQAVLWYPEKYLWKKMGTKLDKELDISYEDAFRKLAQEKGNARKDEAAVRSADGGRQSGDAGAQRVAGKPTGGSDGGVRGGNGGTVRAKLTADQRTKLLEGKEFSRAQAVEDVGEDVVKLVDDVVARPVSNWETTRKLWRNNGYKGLWEGAIYNIFDSQRGWFAAEKRKHGELLDAQFSAWKQMTLAQNAASVAASAIVDAPPKWEEGGVVPRVGEKSLTDIIDTIANKYGQEGLHLWGGYVYAKRAQRLRQENREKLMTPAHINKMLTLGAKYPEFETARKEWVDYNNKILSFAEESGFLSSAQREAWERHGDYAPFYRVLDDGDLLPVEGAGASGRVGAPSKGLRGSDRQIGDVVTNMVRNTEALVRKSVRNNAMRAAENMFHDDPTVMKRVNNVQAAPGLASGAQIKAAIRKKLAQNMGLDPHDDEVNALVKALPLTPEMYEMDILSKPQSADIVWVRGPAPEGSSRSDGIRYYKITDPLVLASATWLPPKPGLVLRAASIPKRILTKGITATPAYMIRNLLRDTLAAKTMYKSGYKPFIDTFKSMSKTIKNKDPAYMALRAGGGTPIGAFYATDTLNRYKKLGGKGNPLVAGMGNFVEIIDRVGSAAENANRLAIFESARKQGKSVAEANFQALDLMNFSSRGGSRIVNGLVSIVPFFNARMQGGYKLARAFGPENRKNLFLWGGTMMAMVLLNDLLNWEDERYESENESSKDNYIHLYLDNYFPKEALDAAGLGDIAENYHIVIPKPFEVGAIFMTAPQRALRYTAGQDKGDEFVERLATNLGAIFKVNPIEWTGPLKPVIENMMNYDTFRGREIVPNFLENEEFKQAEYDTRTAEVLKDLGKVTGLSPMGMDHLIEGWFGTLGAYALATVDTAYRAATGQPQIPGFGIGETKLGAAAATGSGLSAVVRRNDPVYTAYEEEFNQLARAVTDYKNYYNRLKKEDREYARQFREENAELERIDTLVSSVRSQLSSLRKRKERLIQQGRDVEEIRAVEEREAEVTRRFLERYHAMMK